MIKLQDFARQQGVTDRAIQKHLKKYEDELEGLFERKGPNGTWLTEEACDRLRSKMKQQPIVIGEAQHLDEIERLRAELDKCKDKIIALHEEHDSYVKHTTDLLNAAAENQRLLDSSKAEKEKLQKVMEEQKAENEKLRNELTQAQEQAKQNAEDLEDEKTRKIPFKEWFKERRKRT